MNTLNPIRPDYRKDALGGANPRTALVVADLNGNPLSWWFGAPWGKALRAAQEHAVAAVWSIRKTRYGTYCSLETVWESLS